MLGIFFVFFYIISSIYLYYILLKWVNIFSRVFHNKFLKYSFLVVYLVLLFSLIIGYLIPKGLLRHIFQFIGNYFLGIIIYSLIILLIAIILKHTFRKIIIKHSPNKIYTVGGLVGLFLLIFITIYGVINARIIHIKNYEVDINKKANNLSSLNAILISDLHIGYSIGSRHIERMVNKINMKNPDIVLISGDIFDNEYEAIKNPKKIEKLFKSIKSKYGVYAIFGNHDIEERLLMGFNINRKKQIKDNIKMNQLINSSNIKLLKDDYVLIDNSFYIYGRIDYSNGIRRKKSANEITKELDKSKPIIVLDHQPRELNELSNARVDLDLSGHTHDGQIFPINIFIKLFYDNSYGIKKYNDMTSIVTSGVGVYGPNMRVMTKAEIVNIKVKFKK